MGGLLLNPGSESVDGAAISAADANMLAFAADVQARHGYQRVECLFLDAEEGGRYLYLLTGVGPNSRHGFNVEMPGLPLAKVRYLDVNTQNPFDFPRMYVDGSSWLWKFAVNACRPPEDED